MTRKSNMEQQNESLQNLFHDVKNCLNNIAIATALIENELPEECGDAKDYTEQIKINYFRIKTLIKEFKA